MADYKGRLYPRYGLIGGQGPYGMPCDDEEVEVRSLMHTGLADIVRRDWMVWYVVLVARTDRSTGCYGHVSFSSDQADRQY
jgi:hypothetical protein